MATVENVKKTFDYLFKEVGKVVIGQEEMLRQLMIAIFCDSNALLESYPGLAKTLSVKTIAQVMDLKFSRIQNTPDLMPSDITGTYIIEESDGKRTFKFQPGPVFANIVLADEINRATPKTQSALLEAMQEKQVTVGTKTFELDKPFFVLATQNPIEQEGSLALSEHVFINGTLKTGHDLFELALTKEPISEDANGIKLYDLTAWTLSLNTEGRLEQQPCQLYTLPYHDEFITVATRTGKRIQVTKNHPFLVNDHGSMVWKKAEELTKQDFLVNPARISVKEIEPPFTHEEAVEQTRRLMKGKGKPLLAKIPFDCDFAFWIGFLLSDGAIGEKYVEACQKNYPEALDRFVEVSKQYGFSPSIHSRNGCRYARIYSKPLVEYLKIRFSILGGKDKEIPSWFLSFPAELNREFLKTFISLESSLRDNRIVFTQKSRNNVNIISYMLLREGILPWIRHDGRIFRLKIQGQDLARYLSIVGWVSPQKFQAIDLSKKTKSSFRVVPVDRRAILRLVEIFGLNSFHTLKGRTSLTSRPWYCSYKGIKEGEIVMAVSSLQVFCNDLRREIEVRKTPQFFSLLQQDPRRFSASIGTPITTVVDTLGLTKHQVWKFYQGNNLSQGTGGVRQEHVQIQEYLQERHSAVLAEAEALLNYCEGLLSEDVYYDLVKTISYSTGEGMAFGLTVPSFQNYIAGFGGCGINHNTYPLPEAQQDRFLLKIKVTYPSMDDELEIVNRYAEDLKDPGLKPLLRKDSILQLQKLVRQIPVSNDLKKYAVDLVTRTRQKKDLIEYGASPRASIGLILSSKARALLDGRKYVSKEDLNLMALPVLRHRIILNFEAERKGLDEDAVIKSMLK